MVIDGKQISSEIREEIKKEVKELRAKGIVPSIAVVLVGEDPASKVYVAGKESACQQLGIESAMYRLPEETTERELLSLIDELNAQSNINGILVQLPLPKHINEKSVIQNINPMKDVDAFHYLSVGRIMVGDFEFLPCTPAGIMELLSRSNIDIEGKHCVVIGRSNIVGKPMAMLMLHKNATVTICHSKTENLKDLVKQADIIIAAVGKKHFVTADMVKDGAVVVDVGMNRDENGKLCGDVDYQNLKDKCSAITPVPGGVGPMTITMLMKNTVTAAKNQSL